MNKIISRLCIAIAAVLPTAAQATPLLAANNRTQLNAKATGISVERSENKLFVSADIDIQDIRRGTNRELWITPEVVADDNTEKLPAVVLAGRNRFFQAQRLDLPAKENYTLLRQTLIHI